MMIIQLILRNTVLGGIVGGDLYFFWNLIIVDTSFVDCKAYYS